MGEGVTVSEVTGVLQAVGNPKRMQAQGDGERRNAYCVLGVLEGVLRPARPRSDGSLTDKRQEDGRCSMGPPGKATGG